MQKLFKGAFAAPTVSKIVSYHYKNITADAIKALQTKTLSNFIIENATNRQLSRYCALWGVGKLARLPFYFQRPDLLKH